MSQAAKRFIHHLISWECQVQPIQVPPLGTCNVFQDTGDTPTLAWVIGVQILHVQPGDRVQQVPTAPIQQFLSVMQVKGSERFPVVHEPCVDFVISLWIRIEIIIDGIHFPGTRDLQLVALAYISFEPAATRIVIRDPALIGLDSSLQSREGRE